MAFGRAMPYLGTGVRDIDASHEGLAFLLARIFEPGVECDRRSCGCDHSHCRKMSAILTYVGRNFADEAALMDRGGYPHQDAHCGEHRKLENELKAMQAAHVCGERDRAVIRQLVDHWAVHHLQGCDLPLGRWAVTRRVVPPAA